MFPGGIKTAAAAGVIRRVFDLTEISETLKLYDTRSAR
jgi:hypothetical protein